MRKPQALRFQSVGPDDPLAQLGDSAQVRYLRCYLADLGATSVVEEPYYFDRDYLAEFSTFYSTSARGYENVCRRLHFFSGRVIDRSYLEAAAGGHREAVSALQASYLGFIVVRPIPASPLGRTVLRWYPERNPTAPRVIAPSRTYAAHLVGIRLAVKGLAWQQQDEAVGACATVALWSMLHSSAFDEHHAVPTTAMVTEAAHRTASLGSRVFPSDGLTIHQVLEAIKEHELSPLVLDSDATEPTPYGVVSGFSKRRFGSLCATFIRSNYTVLLVGNLVSQGNHAVCAVGYRSGPIAAAAAGEIALEDEGIEYLYIHDDNLGPGVRFRVQELSSKGIVVLLPDAPPSIARDPAVADPSDTYPPFVPQALVVAVQHELRISADVLHRRGMELAQIMSIMLSRSIQTARGLILGTRFVKLRDYFAQELPSLLRERADLLAKVRLELVERVPPMSLHLGIVRIGNGITPVLDVLYDTTDSRPNISAFAHVVLHPALMWCINELILAIPNELGVTIEAF